MANLVANFAPKGVSIPTYSNQIKNLTNYDKTDFKSNAVYDDWETCPLSSFVELKGATTSAQYTWEFPSNRDYIWNTYIKFEFTYTGSTVPTAKDCCITNLLNQIQWYIGSDPVGNMWNGTDQFFYMMTRCTSDEEKNNVISMCGDKSFALVSGTKYEFYFALVGPCHQIGTIFGDNGTSFPLHNLNRNNKKLRCNIQMNPITSAFSSTDVPDMQTNLVFNSIELWYMYTSLAPGLSKSDDFKIVYHQLKPFTNSVALTSGSLIKYSLDLAKSVGECIGIIISAETDANYTANNHLQTSSINKYELYANNDKLMYALTPKNNMLRYLERKKTKNQYLLDTTNYSYVYLPLSKTSIYSELVNLITPGIIINNLQNLYINLDCTSTATFWIRTVAIYKYQFELDPSGNFKLLSNY